MLGSLIAPLIQYGLYAAIAVGAVLLIGGYFVNKYRRKEAERHAKIRDKQAENARNQPRDRDELVDSMSDPDW